MQVPVLWQEKEWGSMNVEPDGGDLSFSCSCRGLPGGLYRLTACGEQTLLLGNAESDGHRLWLRRRFSPRLTDGLGTLRRAELTAVEAAQWERADQARYPGWPEETLMRRGADGVCLAAPYTPQRPFAMPQYFCFARVIQIGERLYTSVRFDDAGQPV